MKAKDTKLNSKIAISYLMKYRRACLNILKPKEDVSQDSSSCLTKNFLKFLLKLKTQRQSKDTLTNALKELVSLK